VVLRNPICERQSCYVLAVDIDHYHHHERQSAAAEAPSTRTGNAGIWDDTDWNNLALGELEGALGLVDKINQAKNVIMFIGDGMGVSTLAAARLYHAESRGLKGEQIYLPWERFPHVALSRVSTIIASRIRTICVYRQPVLRFILSSKTIGEEHTTVDHKRPFTQHGPATLE